MTGHKSWRTFNNRDLILYVRQPCGSGSLSSSKDLECSGYIWTGALKDRHVETRATAISCRTTPFGTSLSDKNDMDVDARREEQRIGASSLFGSRHRGSHPDGWAALWTLLKLNDVAYADDMKGLQGRLVKWGGLGWFFQRHSWSGDRSRVVVGVFFTRVGWRAAGVWWENLSSTNHLMHSAQRGAITQASVWKYLWRGKKNLDFFLQVTHRFSTNLFWQPAWKQDTRRTLQEGNPPDWGPDRFLRGILAVEK